MLDSLLKVRVLEAKLHTRISKSHYFWHSRAWTINCIMLVGFGLDHRKNTIMKLFPTKKKKIYIYIYIYIYINKRDFKMWITILWIRMFSCMELNIFILSNCCGNQMKEKPIAIQYQLTYIIWKIIKFNSMLISFTYPLIQQNSILRKQIPRDTEYVKVNFAKYIQQNL